MQKVSFILNGDRLTEVELNALYEQLNTGIAQQYSIEFLLYVSRAVRYESRSPRITFIHTIGVVPSLKKAIVTAGGNILIFSTVQNVLADTKYSMLRNAVSAAFGLGVPFTQNFMNQLLGLRKIYEAPYIAMEKHFALASASKFQNFGDAIKYANKLLVLRRLQPTDAALPDSIMHRLLFSRPYMSIVEKHWREHLLKVQARKAARKAKKLREQVEPTPYSADIPVFIICRDRVEPLKRLVQWCEDEGLTNLIFVDNASTYPPLLKYFSKTKYEVIRLTENIGQTAPWTAGIVDIYAHNKPFVVTDPDVIPLPESHGAVKLFCRLLNDHPERTKAGFGLKIDDIPDSYELKDYVLAWEGVFWQTPVEPNVYDAEIDTTFAVYRPNTPYTLGPGLRTGGTLVARHEPWYIDSKNLTPEVRYYRDHANKKVGSWGVEAGEVTQTYLTHLHKAGGTKS